MNNSYKYFANKNTHECFVGLSTMDIKINNLEKVNLFASLFQHIKMFTEHINIFFSEEKMFIQAMDNSHVSIFEIVIPAMWFDHYSLENMDGVNVNVKIGVSSTILYNILNSTDKTQTIQMAYENGKDTLCICLKSDTKQVFDKLFEIPLIELETELMDIPEIEYQAEISFPSSYFSVLVGQLKKFGDTAQFKCSETSIEMFAKSPDQGKMMVEINIEDLESFSIEENSELNLSFSLHYLHIICLYSKLSKEVEIKLHNDYPLKIEYFFGENALIRFFLAPKIDDDQ